MASEEHFTDFLNGGGMLGIQNQVCAAGEACDRGDPARMPPHDLDHHDAFVRFGRGMEAVDGFGDDGDGRIEAERLVGGLHVVVDGLGNADHVRALPGEVAGHAERVFSADGNQGFELHLFEILQELHLVFRFSKRVGP